MYNEDLKQKFIAAYTKKDSTKAACLTLFNALEKYERNLNADICTINQKILEPIVNEIVSFRSKYKITRLSILKNYANYCISMKIPGACDGLLKVDTHGLDKVKTHLVSNPMMLQNYLNCLYEPETEETTNNIYRCFYWLAYAGIEEKDILNIRCTDIDFENRMIRYNGLNYPIYKEAVPAFKNCVCLTQFKYINPRHANDKYLNRVPGNQLLRGVKGMQDIKTMRVSLSRVSKKRIDEGKTNLKLSYQRVWLSGLFYRKYEREISGIPVSFMEDAVHFVGNKTYKLDSCRKSISNKTCEIAQNYEEDYQRWKFAFDLHDKF